MRIPAEHKEYVWLHEHQRDVPFIVVSGPSGGGKTTLCNALTQRLPKVELLIKHTNRAIRDGEKEDIDYYFVNDMWFDQFLNQKALIAYADRYRNRYALSCKEVATAYSYGTIPLVVLDVHLALKFKKIYPETCTVFVGPKTTEDIKHRLGSRGDNAEAIAQRVALVDQELALRHQFNFDCDDMIGPEETACNVARYLTERTR